MIRKVLCENDKTGVAVYEENGEVIKEYRDATLYSVSSELVMCTTEWNNNIQGPLRFEYCALQRVFRSVMKKGEKVTISDDKDVLELVRYLAVMEAHGLVHADIKMENIVRIDGKVCMIDYGLLTGRGDRNTTVQTIKDMWGSAVEEGYVLPASEHNAMSAAMYALGVTICLGKGLLDWTDEYTNVSFKSGESEIEVTVSNVFLQVIHNYASLCQSFPLLSSLLCTPQSRAQSFWQLIDVKETRVIYNSLSASTCTCTDIAMCIQGYYMYNVTCTHTLVKLTGGKCMFWFSDESPCARLLREYNEPGTWFIPIKPCIGLDDLARHVSDESPTTIVYSFEGGLTHRISRENLLDLHCGTRSGKSLHSA